MQKKETITYNSKDRVCMACENQIHFLRIEAERREQYLGDLRKTDERTAILAHCHDVDQVRIEGKTTTLRALADETGMDLEMLEVFYNRPDDGGFQNWLDVAVTIAPDHVGAAHKQRINTDEGCGDDCYAHDGVFFRYNGRFEDSFGEIWYINTIDPKHEFDVWARGF